MQMIGDCFRRKKDDTGGPEGLGEREADSDEKQYETVIGLEVHVELATRTKIFCGCSTAFGGAPNTHTCPVCTGMPGSLPVLNRKVVEYAMAVGLAAQLPDQSAVQI